MDTGDAERETTLVLAGTGKTGRRRAGAVPEHAPTAEGLGDRAAVRLDSGAPGPRPEYHYGYYGAHAFDPDGNNVEAVRHAGSSGQGLWRATRTPGRVS